MTKKILLSFIISFFSIISFAQQSINVTGSIKDTTAHSFVKNAVVALVTPQDSVLIKFARTNGDGFYTLPNVPAGKYIFMVMHPLFADYVEDIDINNSTPKLAMVAVTPKSKLLEAVILKSGSPIRIKGDTTIYTADSFKVSANANVEELLKKMPGIQVDKNGQIKAMGETVEKVLVDGEEFFGDDHGMAVKNLRADAVKEVQVFKKKTDQAEFTGIDDGQSKQTINLKLKENKKTGYFGKIEAAGGLAKNINDRYNTNLMLSSFKGKRKLSGFLLNGNTGQDGLNWQDMEKYSGGDLNIEMSDDGDMMIFNNRGGSDDEPYVNTKNGFITNLNAGVQYSNKWKDKNNLNFSPKFNSQLYDNNRINYVQTLLGDSVLNYNAAAQTHVNRYNFKTTGSYDMKLDSNNSLKFTLKTNIYHTESQEDRNSATNGKDGNQKNSSISGQQTNSDKQSFSAAALFKHKFKKNRRTLSLNADWNMLNTDAKNYLKENYADYVNVSLSGQKDQFTAIEKSSQKVSSKIVYTEPLSKKYSIEIAHEVSYNRGTNDNTTYSFSPSSGKFDLKIDSLTNNFYQTIIQSKPSFKLSYAGKKIKYNLGAGVGFTNFNLRDISINKNYNRNYTNFFPSALITYNHKNKSNLRFTYNGSTRQPTINQLQPLKNNNEQFNQTIGNPNLKQSFTNNFNINFDSYNFLKERSAYLGVWSSFIQNSITNNVTIDAANGRTITQPFNTEGNINMGLWSGINFKLKKQDIRVGLNPNFNFSKYAELINSKKNFSKNTSAGISLGLSKSKDKNYDIGIRNNLSYNSNTTSQNTTKSYFTSNTLSAEATVYYKKVWTINSDYNFYYRQKATALSNDQSNHLWNARLQRTFKKNEFTAYLLVRDLLNQNIGIERNFTGIRYTEERNDRLKRYWMLGFKWDFKNKVPKAK